MKLSTARRASMLGLTFGLLLRAVPAGAWEADVHYGLTKWLALQAGYTEEQAGWIADGDLGMDHSPLTDAVHATIISACIGTDPTGSRRVHDFHFPSEANAADEPKNRVVKPGYVQQGGSVRTAPKIDDYMKKA